MARVSKKKARKKPVNARIKKPHPSKKKSSHDELIASLGAETDNNQEKDEAFKRPWHLPLIISSFLFICILLLLAVIYWQQTQIREIEESNKELQDALAELAAQNSFYKKAYEVTLDDIKLLSANYGGEEQYEKLADDLRDQELESVIKTPENKSIDNPEIWDLYFQGGIIQIECLGEPVRVDTIKDETLITFNTDGEGEFLFYIDANLIGLLSVGSEKQITLPIPSGKHAIDIVSRTGNLKVNELFFDTNLFPVETFTVDPGDNWEVFDCIDTTKGNHLTEPGALRVLIDKK